MIIDKKITAWEHPVVNEADQPIRSASDMKQVFDANSNQLKESLNELIDELLGTGAAAQLGSDAISGLDGATVRAQIAALMTLKISSADIKRFRLNGNGYLECSLDGETWSNVPTWGEVEIADGGEAKNLIVSFNEAEELGNILPGENLQTMFGKINKWFSSGAAGILNLESAEDVRAVLEVPDAEDISALQVSVSDAQTNITALQKSEQVFTTAGTAPAFTVTDTSVTAYTAGLRRTVQFHAAGTSVTLNFNGLGAKALYEYTGKQMSVKAGHVVEVYYNGTSFFGVSVGGGVSFPDAPVAGTTSLKLICGTSMSPSADNVYENITGRSFTIMVSGTYRFRYSVSTNYLVSNSVYAKLTKNGADVANSEVYTTVGTYETIHKTIDIVCAAGDVIREQIKGLKTIDTRVTHQYIIVSILAADIQTAIDAIVT